MTRKKFTISNNIQDNKNNRTEINDLKVWFLDQVHGLLGLPIQECESKFELLIQFKRQIILNQDQKFLDDLLGRSELIQLLKLEILKRLKGLEESMNQFVVTDARNDKNGHKENHASSYSKIAMVWVENNQTENDTTTGITTESKKNSKNRKNQKTKLTTNAFQQELKTRSIVGKGGKTTDGRWICECLAQVHGLVANCLNCGKIICEMEGLGPCSFCSTELEPFQVKIFKSTKKKQEQQEREQESELTNNIHVLSSKNKTEYHIVDRWRLVANGQPESSTIVPVVKKQQDGFVSNIQDLSIQYHSSESSDNHDHSRDTHHTNNKHTDTQTSQIENPLNKATALRDRLLDYDKNSVARTKVHDIASDFEFSHLASRARRI